MAERTIKTFNIGDLVMWYEPYADGDLVRDVGSGIILKSQTYELGFASGPYTNYEVYRDKHGDTMRFSANELEKIT